MNTALITKQNIEPGVEWIRLDRFMSRQAENSLNSEARLQESGREFLSDGLHRGELDKWFSFRYPPSYSSPLLPTPPLSFLLLTSPSYSSPHSYSVHFLSTPPITSTTSPSFLLISLLPLYFFTPLPSYPAHTPYWGPSFPFPDPYFLLALLPPTTLNYSLLLSPIYNIYSPFLPTTSF